MKIKILMQKYNNIVHTCSERTYSFKDFGDDGVESIKGEILDNDDKQLGTIFGHLISCDKYRKSCSDNLKSEIEKIVESGVENLKNEKIFVLDSILIFEKFRNKGIGSLAMTNLPKILNNQFGSGKIIYLCATPLEVKENDKNFEKYKKELVTFFEKFNFVVVKDNIMCFVEK